MKTIKKLIKLLPLAFIISVALKVPAQSETGTPGKPMPAIAPATLRHSIKEAEQSPLNRVETGPSRTIEQGGEEEERTNFPGLTPEQIKAMRVYNVPENEVHSHISAPPILESNDNITNQRPCFTFTAMFKMAGILPTPRTLPDRIIWYCFQTGTPEY